jgi:predicted dienelactone hydrolase
MVVKDPSRKERFSTDRGAIRQLPVKVWYPARPGASGPVARYAAPESLTTLLPAALNHRLQRSSTHAFADAPVADLQAEVLVFSHGYTGYAEQNTVQMEELASRGYVVASIVHPGEAAWAPFPDGLGIPYAAELTARARQRARELKPTFPELKRKVMRLQVDLDSPDRATRDEAFRERQALFDEPVRTESVREWARDTRAVVDHFEGLQAGSAASPFSGRLNLERLGVLGMSYGGATAVEFARTDARCRAAINIDGLPFGGLIDGTLATPLLTMACPGLRSQQVPALDRMTGPAYLVTVPDTTHAGFTDLPWMFPRWLRRNPIVGKLDAARRSRCMNEFIVGFFEQYLRGGASDILDGALAAYNEVPGQTRNLG